MSEDLTTWGDALETVIARSPGPRAIDRVAVLSEAASTQDAARAMCGGRPGLMVTCGVQTGGRGRLGRAWHDAPGKSLAMSVVLDAARFDPALVSLGAGVAVAGAGARACGVGRLGLRWPNDVVEPGSGRKLAGVLIERSGGLLIVGIGMNVSQRDEDWPEALRGSGVSLAAMGSGISRLDVACLLVSELESALAMPKEALCRAWGACDVLVGTVRTFESGGERWTGLVRSIVPTSEIVIESASGVRHTLAAQTTSLVHGGGCEPQLRAAEGPGG